MRLLWIRVTLNKMVVEHLICHGALYKNGDSVGIKTSCETNNYFFFNFHKEPTVWESAEEIQEQQWLAEALGGLHQLQSVLLQDPSGKAFFKLNKKMRIDH